MSLEAKKIRKHRGIQQTGPSAGRLKKGFKYSGKRLKSGLAEIVEAKNSNKNKSITKTTQFNKLVDNANRKVIKPNINVSTQNIKNTQEITKPHKKCVASLTLNNKKNSTSNKSGKEILYTEQSLIDNYSEFVSDYLLNKQKNTPTDDIEPIHKLIMDKTVNKMLEYMTNKKNINNNTHKKIKSEINSNKNINDISFQINSNWNSSAIPLKSSLNKLKSTESKKRKNKIKWGNISIRTYEQRAGISSCAVPNTVGPSLYLGSLLNEKTLHIDEYEINKDKVTDEYEALTKKERIERVKKFRSSDLQKKKLKEDSDEIKSIQKSRNAKKGCDCLSIYKMKKSEIMDTIIHLRGEKECMIKLKKLKKEPLLDKLKQIQFDIYGRYDVCCIDETCYCFKNDIGCHIDSEACSCGGYVVYNNYLNEDDINSEKKINKRDSYACGNNNGNTLNVNVLDHVYKKEKETKVMDDVENDICEIANNGEMDFKSKEVKNILSEWSNYYQ